MNKNIIIAGILLLLEWMLYTVWLNAVSHGMHGLLLILVGFLFCWIGWQSYDNIYSSNQQIAHHNQSAKKHNFWLPLLVYCIVAIGFGYYFVQIYQPYRIHKDESDVIVTLQMYIKRLVSNEQIYAPIDYGSWTVIPNYLTMQWLPYIIPHFLGIDYRLFSYIFFVIVYGIILYHSRKLLTTYTMWIGLILPFILLFFIARNHSSVFGHTTELVIASYYLILAYSIWKGKWWLLTLGIAICLLSRFSFVFWLPFLAYYVIKLYSWKYFGKVALGVFAIAFVVYIFPFMIDDPLVFFKGMKYYADAAVGEWTVSSYQQKGELPYHLQKGVGIAYFFYNLQGIDVHTKLYYLRILQIVACLIVVACSILLIVKWPERFLNPFFALISLKVYFIIFYSTIHVPYLYLQVTHLITSLYIFVALLQVKSKKSVAINSFKI